MDEIKPEVISISKGKVVNWLKWASVAIGAGIVLFVGWDLFSLQHGIEDARKETADVKTQIINGTNSAQYLNACIQAGFCPLVQAINDRLTQIQAQQPKK